MLSISVIPAHSCNSFVGILDRVPQRMEYNNEHLRFYTYVELRRGKTATEIKAQLEESGIADLPSFSTIWRWCDSFHRETRMSLHNDPHSGRPRSVMTADNIQLVNRLISEMPKQSTRMLSDDTSLSKDAVHRGYAISGGNMIMRDLTLLHKPGIFCCNVKLSLFGSLHTAPI
jgi:hypothetical protein